MEADGVECIIIGPPCWAWATKVGIEPLPLAEFMAGSGVLGH